MHTLPSSVRETSRNVLKGTLPAPLDDNGRESVATEDGSVRLVQHTKETELRTTTIPVPEATAERIKRGGEMPYPEAFAGSSQGQP